MLLRKNILPHSAILFSLFVILAWATSIAFVHAAILGISPYNETVALGKTVTVHVVVNSQGQSINAVSGQITFSNDRLTLVSISKSGSIISLWPQNPAYSNASGAVSFQGVILNGFNGTGTVLTLVFKAVTTGTASVAISSANSSVLLNDGNGTNALNGTTSDTITITKAPVIQSVEPNNPAIIPAIPAIPAAKLPLPVITDYQTPLLSSNFIVIKGNASPNSTLTATLTRIQGNGTAAAAQSLVNVGSDGTFVYVSDKKVLVGQYSLIFTTTDAQNTKPLSITVKSPLNFVITGWFMAILSFKIKAFLLFLVIIAAAYAWYRNRVLQTHLRHALDKIHNLEQK